MTTNASMVKVGIEIEGVPFCSREWLWARMIAPFTAKIENIPFFAADLSLGDLVRFDKRNMIVQVLERGAKTMQLSYYARVDEAGVESQVQEIREILGQLDISCESACAGHMSLSVPRDVGVDRVTDALAALDFEWEVEGGDRSLQ